MAYTLTLSRHLTGLPWVIAYHFDEIGDPVVTPADRLAIFGIHADAEKPGLDSLPPRSPLDEMPVEKRVIENGTE